VTDGASVVIDFDARTGVHKLTIDTSVHADYAVGSDYMVLIEGATVDAGNVTAAIFTFSIENRFTNVAKWLGTAPATPTVAGVPEVDITHVAGATTNVAALATNVDAILTDTGTAGVVIAAAQTVATATNLTNLPTIPTNWITADGIAAAAITDTELTATGSNLTAITGVTLAADQAVNATKLGGATVTATTSVTFPAASTVATSEIIATGTATGGSTLTLQDTNRTETDTFFIGKMLRILYASGQIENVLITDYNFTTDTFTWQVAKTTVPSGATYEVRHVVPVNTVKANDATIIGDGNATPWDGI